MAGLWTLTPAIEVQILTLQPSKGLYMSKERRAIAVRLKDGTSKFLELSRATAIRSDVGLLHLDKFKDGTWRLTFSEDVIDDFSKIIAFEIVRDVV